jgi:hypothetical protein
MCVTDDLLLIRYATFLRNSLNEFALSDFLSPNPPLYKFQPVTVSFISIYKQAVYRNFLHFYATTRHRRGVGRVLAVRRLGLRTNDQRTMVRISRKAIHFSFLQNMQTSCGPNKPPIHCVPRVIFLGVKRPGRENDHSSPSSADSNSELSYSVLLHPIECLQVMETPSLLSSPPTPESCLVYYLELFHGNCLNVAPDFVSCFFQCVDLFQTPYLLNFPTNMSHGVESEECWVQRPHLIVRPCKLSCTVFKRECNFCCQR